MKSRECGCITTDDHKVVTLCRAHEVAVELEEKGMNVDVTEDGRVFVHAGDMLFEIMSLGGPSIP